MREGPPIYDRALADRLRLTVPETVEMAVGINIRRQELLRDPVYGVANAATFALFEALQRQGMFDLEPNHSTDFLAFERRGNQIALATWGIGAWQTELAHWITDTIAQSCDVKAMMTSSSAAFMMGEADLQPITKQNFRKVLGRHIVLMPRTLTPAA